MEGPLSLDRGSATICSSWGRRTFRYHDIDNHDGDGDDDDDEGGDGDGDDNDDGGGDGDEDDDGEHGQACPVRAAVN